MAHNGKREEERGSIASRVFWVRPPPWMRPGERVKYKYATSERLRQKEIQNIQNEGKESYKQYHASPVGVWSRARASSCVLLS